MPIPTNGMTACCADADATPVVSPATLKKASRSSTVVSTDWLTPPGVGDGVGPPEVALDPPGVPVGVATLVEVPAGVTVRVAMEAPGVDVRAGVEDTNEPGVTVGRMSMS